MGVRLEVKTLGEANLILMQAKNAWGSKLHKLIILQAKSAWGSELDSNISCQVQLLMYE